MSEVWVVNASPIIVLAKIGRLDLLVADGRELLVPMAVAGEVRASAPTDPAHVAIAGGFGAPHLDVSLEPRVGQWSLGVGESAVLSLALERAAVAIVDDRDARRAARSLGLRALGTLGVVLRARRDGRIPSAADVIRELRQAGLRLDDDVIRIALAEAFGEEWQP